MLYKWLGQILTCFIIHGGVTLESADADFQPSQAPAWRSNHLQCFDNSRDAVIIFPILTSRGQKKLIQPSVTVASSRGYCFYSSHFRYLLSGLTFLSKQTFHSKNVLKIQFIFFIFNLVSLLSAFFPFCSIFFYCRDVSYYYNIK